MSESNALSYAAARSWQSDRTDVRPLTRAEIARAIPRGSRRARSQARYLEALARDPELAALRSDRQQNIREAARILARYASWQDRTTRPTRARLCQLAKFSESTWKACRRWLEAHGWLGLVRGGRTPWLRAGVLTDAEAGNEAAVYVLAIPRSTKTPAPAAAPLTQETRPLSPSGRTVVEVPAHAQSQDRRSEPARAGTHRLEAVARRLRIGPGEPISEGWVRYLVGPFARAGWIPSDLTYAIDHEPSGAPHTMALRTVREPRAWLAWRLSRWIGGDGQPMASPSQLRAHNAHQSRAEQLARRAAAAELAARRADPAPYAAAIRARLGWRPPSSRGSPP